MVLLFICVLKGIAVDVIIIEQSDSNTFLSSPFHVRFGKFGVTLNPSGKRVDIEVDGAFLPDIYMKLDETGTATNFFVGSEKETEVPVNDLIKFFNYIFSSFLPLFLS